MALTQGTARVNIPYSPLFLWKDLFAYHYTYSLRSSLLILSRELHMQVLSLCCPSAVFRNTSISRRGAFTCILCPNIYIWCHGFCSCHSEDTLWLPGSGSQGGLCSWVLWDFNSWRVSSWQDTIIGHYTDNRLRHHPVFLWKSHIWLSWSFSLKGRLLAHIKGPTDMFSENVDCWTPCPLCLATTHQ